MLEHVSTTTPHWKHRLPFLAVFAALGCSDVTEGIEGLQPGDAAGVLPVNCNAAAYATKPECVTPDCTFVGTIGGGQKLGCPSGFSARIVNGTLDVANNRLVVAVDSGAVATIDFSTGERAMLSGTYEDPATGTVARGSGPAIPDVHDVLPWADGSWLAVARYGELTRVDATTGDRTILWDDDNGPVTCAGSSKPLYPRTIAVAVGDDGSLYMTVDEVDEGTSKTGILRFAGTALECSVVSMANAPVESDNKGTGPTDFGPISALAIRNGTLWAAANLTQSLLEFDIATGNRIRVSSYHQSVGSGTDEVGNQAVVVAADKVWTFGMGFGQFRLTSVDPVTGARRGYPASAGPAQFSGFDGGMWLVPKSSVILVAQDTAIVAFDPATGNSNLFSW